MRGYRRKLDLAEAEYARYPSHSTLDRMTYLRAIVEISGETLTADQINTLVWIAAGSGRRLREVTNLRRRDLTCVEKKSGALVEHARVRGEPWIFVSDAGRFLLRELSKAGSRPW
jgi:hypothetical protein